MDRVKRIWHLSPMRAAKVQASLRIRAVSPEPSLLAHTSSKSRGTFRQKARFLAPLNGWACAVEICHDGMLKDTNSLDRAHIINSILHSQSISYETYIWKACIINFIWNKHLCKILSIYCSYDLNTLSVRLRDWKHAQEWNSRLFMLKTSRWWS